MAMASEGKDLSSSMSAEAQNTDNSTEKTALRLFKKHKVAISHKIKDSFPFFELLHDNDFITSEMYNVSKETFKKGQHTEEVVCNVLTEAQKKFEPSLLKILFDEVTLEKNPDLNHIYEIFKNGIPDINFFSKSEAEEDKEMCDIQSSLEQVTISDGSEKCEDGDEPPKASTSAVKRKTGQQPVVPVNFQDEILPVTCKEKRGFLIKRKWERGTTTKCITKEEMCSFTLGEFEVKGGYKKSGYWKERLCCGGRTLKDLMKDGILPTPPRKYGINIKGGDSDKCKICQDGGKLFLCETCHSSFHEHCHLPPVDTQRNHKANWNCTFCKIKSLQRSQQHYRESEVLKKVMGPDEQLVQEASRCLEKLRELDKIKESLIKGHFPHVESFMQAMDNFFTILKCNDAELTQDDFKKNFKDIFDIQETN